MNRGTRRSQAGKLVIVTLLALLWTLLPLPAGAEYFTIESFRSVITVREDSSFTVQETISRDRIRIEIKTDCRPVMSHPDTQGVQVR